MIPISVCIIAKNEEAKIARCLQSLQPYSFEIIIVDTGSSDGTKEIAKKYTNHIYDYKWTDDFSAARNFSLEKASHNWIFILDCDETIQTLDFEELQYFCLNLPLAVGSVNRVNITGISPDKDFYTDRTERFFNKKYYHYTGLIHEQLTPLNGRPFDNLLLQTTLLHDGYLLTEEQRQEKANRNLTLLIKEIEQESCNPYLYYQVGKTYESAGNYASAYEYYAKGLTFNPDTELAYVQAMVIGYGRCLLHSNSPKLALSLKEIRPSFSSSADFIYLLGLIYKANGMYEEALEEFSAAVDFEFANENGANSFLAYYQMGTIFMLDGDIDTATACFLTCGDYSPAIDALTQLKGI